MRFIATLQVMLLVAALVPSAFGQTTGPIGVRPHYRFGTVSPQRPVGSRYKIRINANADNDQVIKILYAARSFVNPNRTEPAGFYQLEFNLYSYWLRYPDIGCLGWPPRSPTGEVFHSQGGLWVSVPDYPATEPTFPRALRGRVGIRPSNLQRYPRQSSGINNIASLTKIETIGQQNMVGKDIELELVRGDTFTNDLSNWGFRFDPNRSDNLPSSCLADLPRGSVYRRWLVTARYDGETFRWDVALPEEQARFLDPNRIVDFVTEFFELRGTFQVFAWDFFFQEEGQPAWIPISDFKVTYQVLPGRNTGSGVRIGTYQGRRVLEFSNDRTDTYAQLNDIITLSDSTDWPRITAVANGASFQPGISPGSAVSIFGRNLSGTTRSVSATDIVTSRLPFSLDGVRVWIDNLEAPVIAISPDQINVQAPNLLGRGRYPVRVATSKGEHSMDVDVQATSPAFFTFSDGKQVAAQHADYTYLARSGSLPGAVAGPARPGETVILYATGLGATNPGFPIGQFLPGPVPLAAIPTVRVGGERATVVWAGVVSPLLWQVNVQLPDRLASGDLPILLEAGGRTTQSGATLAIAAP
jgi:uncharacterized protein (TIGR03437 family)